MKTILLLFSRFRVSPILYIVGQYERGLNNKSGRTAFF